MNATNNAPAIISSRCESAPLESVLCSEQLTRRLHRRPNYATENRVLSTLAQALADSPHTILQTMAEQMLEVFRCGSAGFSLLSSDDNAFYLPAIAGAWQPYAGGVSPRDFSPWGDVLDRNAPLLFNRWERRYPYLLEATPLAEEGLLVPFHVQGKAVGAIWAITHDEHRKFNAEDLRVLESLGKFAATAYCVGDWVNSRAQRRAALNLMQDAVEARQIAEDLNAELSASRERLAEEVTSARVLQEISTRMFQQGDIDALWEQVLDATVIIMRSDMATMQAVDERENALRMLAFRGFDAAFGKAYSLNRPDKRACSVARRLGHRVIVPDVERCDFLVGTPELQHYRKTGVRAVQSTPLISRARRLLGMISTHWRKPHEPSERELRLLDVLARQAADLIDRKQAEEALRENEAKYKAIFDGVAVSLWEADFSGIHGALEGLKAAGVSDFRRYFAEHRAFVQEALALIRVVDVNGATLKMFEAPDKAELFRSIPHIVPAESLPVFIEQLVTLAEGRTGMQGEALLNTLRGNRVNVLFTMTVSSAAQGLERVLFSLLDITERTRLEKQTQEQAATLADLDRRKDEFLAMLSHELRGPLAPIANAVRLLRLQDGNLSEGEQAACATIERQVAQLKYLVGDLLEVSRITTGKLQLQRKRIALADIVETAVETVRPLVQKCGHSLSVSLPPEPVWLHADAARLEQVVVNLLTNAAKFTDNGGRIGLTVELEGDTAVLRVRDSGIGIAPELLAHIFEPFIQAQHSLDRSQAGLGIGLSLVQRLVELHGGTVEAVSIVGQGSDFVVRLPMTSGCSPAELSLETARSTGPTCPSRRILVVDDNVDSAESLAMLLQAWRHEVRTAHDSPTALGTVLEYRPDVVLLDIGMPGLNGYEIAARIRQERTLADIVLVAVTGYGQDKDRQRSRDAGFDHHLVKPVDFDTVQRILADVQ
jgi:signal transduction histidine kinase/GAF domain-containing protein